MTPAVFSRWLWQLTQYRSSTGRYVDTVGAGVEPWPGGAAWMESPATSASELTRQLRDLKLI